ncbi:MAG TPA: hypothetical protein PKY82_33355, partial [Pyrinomonadaceae bacterium]|nr:hypothetical protein [Pyrinomonadaceae bacterium]
NDDEKLWSFHRRRVARESESSIVLIGSSRMQIGLNQSKFTELTRHKTIQLAVTGESPIPVLKDFAEDESFRGTIISDFADYLIYQKEKYPNYPQQITDWIKFYHESKTGDDFEFRLQVYGRYLVANPNLGKNTPEVLKNIVTGQAFESRNAERLITDVHPTFFDRSLIFDMDKFLTREEKNAIIDMQRQSYIETLKSAIQKDPPQPQFFLEISNKIEEYVKKIQSRGGKVIIVYFPTSGEVGRLNEIALPRKLFWDVLATKTTAKTIHFQDYPQLQFECPDGSHLDPKDTPKFTEELVKIIGSDLQK